MERSIKNTLIQKKTIIKNDYELLFLPQTKDSQRKKKILIFRITVETVFFRNLPVMVQSISKWKTSLTQSQ